MTAASQLEKLLNFSVHLDRLQDNALIYEQLNEFLEKTLQANPLVVFSRPKKINKKMRRKIILPVYFA